jgi:hypothetical protein
MSFSIVRNCWHHYIVFSFKFNLWNRRFNKRASARDPVKGFCKNINESVGSIKSGDFFFVGVSKAVTKFKKDFVILCSYCFAVQEQLEVLTDHLGIWLLFL